MSSSTFIKSTVHQSIAYWFNALQTCSLFSSLEKAKQQSVKALVTKVITEYPYSLDQLICLFNILCYSEQYSDFFTVQQIKEVEYLLSLLVYDPSEGPGVSNQPVLENGQASNGDVNDHGEDLVPDKPVAEENTLVVKSAGTGEEQVHSSSEQHIMTDGRCEKDRSAAEPATDCEPDYLSIARHLPNKAMCLWNITTERNLHIYRLDGDLYLSLGW
ncbi:MAG: hypothetical protein ACFFD4_34595 [Candidatus Odinarchaeota archaeon]